MKETLNKDFHSTSLRKMWDTYVNDNCDKIPDIVFSLVMDLAKHTTLANLILRLRLPVADTDYSASMISENVHL